MDQEYRSRAEASSHLITSLRQEVEDQQGILEKARKQNFDLNEELDQQEDYLQNRLTEINNTKAEIDASAMLNGQLTAQSKQLDADITNQRDANSRDCAAINDLHYQNDCRNKDLADLTAKVAGCEHHKEAQGHTIGDLNNMLTCKTTDLGNSEAQLAANETEITALSGQSVSF